MQPNELLLRVIRPAHAMLTNLASRDMGGPAVEVLSLTIALQESSTKYRAQINGPARSYWQFERRGGFAGVLSHPRTETLAADLIEELNLPTDEPGLWTAFPYNDLLAAGFARLLIYSDNAPVPALGESGNAWAYYLRNWRPGKPRPAVWAEYYKTAMDAVQYSSTTHADPELLDQIWGHVRAACKLLESMP
jgi:hypothetical protein